MSNEQARLLEVIEKAELAIQYFFVDRIGKDDKRASIELIEKMKTGLNDIRELIKQRFAEYKDLGWMNSWSNFPDGYLKCRELQHITKDVSYYQSGSHHEVFCDICMLKWHYDSSG